jgi:hypothetical protein
MSDAVQQITIQLRAPKGNDAGKVAIGYYVVNPDRDVVLCDENGRPIDGMKQHLDGPDCEAKPIACAMLRRREKANMTHAQ